MLKIKQFEYNRRPLRTIIINDRIWFLGRDIAHMLGYSRPSNAIFGHVESSDRRTLSYKACPKIGRAYHIWSGSDFSSKEIIDRSGVFALIEASRLPMAGYFRHWLNHEVLPDIMDNGYYVQPKAESSLVGHYMKMSKGQALILAGKNQIRFEQAERELTIDKPKATKYDKYINSPALMTTTVIAKDWGMSAMGLNRILNNERVIYKQGRYWVLYSKYQNMNLAHYCFYTMANGYQAKSLKWTAKGRRFIFHLLSQLGYNFQKPSKSVSEKQINKLDYESR